MADGSVMTNLIPVNSTRLKRAISLLSNGDKFVVVALYSWFKAHPAATLADFADAWRRARRLEEAA